MNASPGWLLADGRSVRSLSNDELRTEVRRRRRKRAGAELPPATASQRQVAQWLANLELPARATPAEVDAAYARLVEKYESIAARATEGRRQAADTLLQSLRQAYEGLKHHADD